jgi:two-component system NtrC family response regulator
MAEGNKITPVDLEMETPRDKYEGASLKEAREALERDMVTRVLARNNDNVTRAAEELGVSRPTLYELMEKLGIGRK